MFLVLPTAFELGSLMPWTLESDAVPIEPPRHLSHTVTSFRIGVPFPEKSLLRQSGAIQPDQFQSLSRAGHVKDPVVHVRVRGGLWKPERTRARNAFLLSLVPRSRTVTIYFVSSIDWTSSSRLLFHYSNARRSGKSLHIVTSAKSYSLAQQSNNPVHLLQSRDERTEIQLLFHF